MAGFGSRFLNKGFTEPKPLIKLKGKPIVQYAVESLKIDGLYVFVTRGFNIEESIYFEEIIKKIGITYKHVQLNFPTKGATETALIGIDGLNLSEKLVITNCDQYTPWNVDRFFEFVDKNNYDGIVSTYDHGDIEVNKPSRYSFIKIDENTKCGVQLSEKFAISKDALNGIHFWKNGRLFFDSATELMNDDLNTEYFISLTFNKMISRGYKIGAYNMNSTEFYALGTPDEVEKNMEYL